MEMDPMTIAIIIILVIVVGIFIGSMMDGGSAVGGVVSSAPAQYSGGACGR